MNLFAASSRATMVRSDWSNNTRTPSDIAFTLSRTYQLFSSLTLFFPLNRVSLYLLQRHSFNKQPAFLLLFLEYHMYNNSTHPHPQRTLRHPTHVIIIGAWATRLLLTILLDKPVLTSPSTSAQKEASPSVGAPTYLPTYLPTRSVFDHRALICSLFLESFALTGTP